MKTHNLVWLKTAIKIFLFVSFVLLLFVWSYTPNLGLGHPLDINFV
jgi:hypothetical protein